MAEKYGGAVQSKNIIIFVIMMDSSLRSKILTCSFAVIIIRFGVSVYELKKADSVAGYHRTALKDISNMPLIKMNQSSNISTLNKPLMSDTSLAKKTSMHSRTENRADSEVSANSTKTRYLNVTEMRKLLPK